MTRGTLNAIVTLGGMLVACSSQAASAQNFFATLFGGGAQPREGRSAYEQDHGSRPSLFGWESTPSREGVLDPNDPRLHREIIRRRAARPHVVPPRDHDASTGKQKAIEPTAEAPAGSLALFSKDKTLRAGDVVVTNRGFLVYQGGGRQDASAYVAVTGSGAGKSDRVSLLALEHVSRMTTPNVTYTNTKVQRDFIGPRLPDQMEARAETVR